MAALFQSSLETPAPDAVARAYGRVPGLTALDGRTAAFASFGILARNVPSPRALALTDALREEGVTVHVVADEDVPSIPAPTIVTRVEATGRSLVAHLVGGSSREVPWADVRALAAGSVTRESLSREQSADTWDQRSGEALADGTPVAAATKLQMRRTEEPTLAMALTDGVTRLEAHGPRLDYAPLGPLKGPSAAHNFRVLVGEVARRAIAAELGRGARNLTGRTGRIDRYPNERAFEDELRWLLWRSASTAPHGESPPHS